MNGFLITPKPRELTEKEIDKFNLRYHNEEKSVMEPVFEHTGNVWSAANDGKLPTYRLYNYGTNYLKVLRYTPSKDVWEEVKLEDISNLYGFMWNMCLKLENQTPFDMTTTLVSGGNYYDLTDQEPPLPENHCEVLLRFVEPPTTLNRT